MEKRRTNFAPPVSWLWIFKLAAANSCCCCCLLLFAAPPPSVAGIMSTNKPKFVLPSREQVEQARRQQGKQQTLFFKGKSTESAEDRPRSALETAQPAINTSPSTTTPHDSTFTATAPSSSSSINPAISDKSNVIPSSSPSSSPKSTATTSTATKSSSTPQPTVKRTVGNAILVNPLQYKNPILKHIHNVPWEPDDSIRCDYLVGQTTGVLYLR